MRFLILSLIVFWTGLANADTPLKPKTSGWRLLEADALYFEAANYWHFYDPYFDVIKYEYDDFGNRKRSPENWTYGIAAGFDLTFVEKGDFKIYWKNRVEGSTTNHQFRRVAWKYDFGVSYEKVDIFWKHRSEHLADVEHREFYPLVDSFGFRLHFLGR